MNGLFKTVLGTIAMVTIILVLLFVFGILGQ